MKYYVVSDSVAVLKATPAALSKALFSNDRYLGFKNLDDATRLAKDGVHPFDTKAYAVYEIQVTDKSGIKAGECVLSNDEVIENVVEINRLKAKDFTVICAYLNGNKLPVAHQQVEAPKTAPKTKAVPMAGSKAKSSSEADIELIEVKQENEAPKAKDKVATQESVIVVEDDVEVNTPAAPLGRFARAKAYISSINPQLAKAIISASVLGLASLAARAAIVSGLVVVTAPVVAVTALAATAIAAAAYYGPSAYARLKLTRKERYEADIASASDMVEKLNAKLADKTPADNAFIVDLNKFEEAAPFAQFKDNGADVDNQPAITKVHVVQFKKYAMEKVLAAKPEERANVEKELLAEAAKKFAPAAK